MRWGEMVRRLVLIPPTLVGVAAIVFVRWVSGAWSGREVRAIPELPRAVIYGLIVLAALFMVARNLPGSWLAP